MTLEELKIQAAAILSLLPASSFDHEIFCTGSGGGPVNLVDVPEVHRDSVRKYHTVRHGYAYAGCVVIECRNTGVKDADGRAIYETPSGVVFVYQYRAGSPERFDSGRLVPPNLGE